MPCSLRCSIGRFGGSCNVRNEPFPIIQITDEMILQDEPMGGKDKFWCQLPDDAAGGGRWLFKQPRQEPEKMEHLAEKIAQELADLIRVPCARTELAQYGDIRGTVSKDVQEADEVLVHGNEIIAGRVMGYDVDRKRRTSDHTFQRIQQAIMQVCKGTCAEVMRQFAGYLILDALVGNTDRHHENWALLRRESKASVTYRLAPSFDHASSLGREMRDERRRRLLEQDQLEAYIEKGQGAIYVADLGEQTLCPMDLVRRLTDANPEWFRSCGVHLDSVTSEKVDGIISRIPDGWISESQKAFVAKLVQITRQLLSNVSK